MNTISKHACIGAKYLQASYDQEILLNEKSLDKWYRARAFSQKISILVQNSGL